MSEMFLQGKQQKLKNSNKNNPGLGDNTLGDTQKIEVKMSPVFRGGEVSVSMTAAEGFRRINWFGEQHKKGNLSSAFGRSNFWVLI